MIGIELVIADAQAAGGLNIIDIISMIFTNERILISMLIQFLLGVAVGYYFAKAIKYLIALVLVLIIGSLLNVWSFSASMEDGLTRYFRNMLEYKDEALMLIKIFGALLVGPVLVGFMIGLVIGLTRK